MANLLDLLQNQLDDDLVDNLSQKLGGVDKKQTATAAQGVMSTLVSALAKNAASPEGVSGLANALDRDHDGSILDNLTDLLGGKAQPRPEQARALNGNGIVKHMLGDRQNGAIDMISKVSGLDSGKTGNLMSMLAPVVMGILGKQKRGQGLDTGGLAGLLSGTVSEQKKSGNPLMDMATNFLDKDGGGSALDDVAGMLGKGLFSKFFGRK
ncbi:MAG: DUF937 domain-containing protein [Saprospiraceae bacterium]